MNSAHLLNLLGVSNYRDTSVKMILETTSLKLKCRLVLSIMIYCSKNHGKELLIVNKISKCFNNTGYWYFSVILSVQKFKLPSSLQSLQYRMLCID